MKSVLIVSHNQYGHQINTYKMAHYLRSRYHVSYVCMDYGRERVREELADVIYVKRHLFAPLRATIFLYHILRLAARIKPTITVVKYFPLCSIICLKGGSKRILAIQTGSVSRSQIRNKLMNLLLKFESNAYDARIVLSGSMINMLRIKRDNTYVVPLGGEPIRRLNSPHHGNIRLLYVGSLNNRNVDITLKGLKLYRERNPNVDVSYRIIGFGSEKVEDELKRLVVTLDLNSVVRFEGLVPNTKLESYFCESDVGISFVPMTPYYDVQPPSKTIEYLLAGLPVLATRTSENEKLIDGSNGILIDDNELSFSEGLAAILSSKFDSNAIRAAMMPLSWQNIIRNMFCPILESITDDD